jgi:hypothetical protein
MKSIENVVPVSWALLKTFATTSPTCVRHEISFLFTGLTGSEKLQTSPNHTTLTPI